MVTRIFSRLPQPATEQDCVGRTSLSPPEDEGIYLVRACGLRTSDPATVGIGLGGLIRPPPNTHLVGLPFTDDDFLDFRLHGPRMRVDDLCAFHEGPIPRVFSDVFAVTSRLYGGQPVVSPSVLSQPHSRSIQALCPQI